MPVPYRVLGLLLVGLVLVSCTKPVTKPKAANPPRTPLSPSGPVGLTVGKVAPEIEGEGIDGVAFNLSDYRGKVVLLAFWGHW